MAEPKISIVIPTLNEEQFLQRCLLHISIAHPKGDEIIVSDGKSSDGTIDIARENGCIVVENDRRGRAIQMNAGAKIATGDILCFVHADTFVPADYTAVVLTTLADKNIACGGFKTIISGGDKTYWSISFHNFIKTYYSIWLRPHLHFIGFRALFGDHAMFCRRKDFIAVGMFDENYQIMEDVELCKKLCRLGKIKLVDRVVETSSRRIEKWGIVKSTIIHLYIGVLSQLGVPISFLQKVYRPQKELEQGEK